MTLHEHCRNGAVCHESVLALRNKLDKFGDTEHIAYAEKVNFQTRMAVYMFYYIIYLLWTDPKEFLYMLFKHVLTADPFCTIRCVASNDWLRG